jgi:hypothetical protein
MIPEHLSKGSVEQMCSAVVQHRGGAPLGLDDEVYLVAHCKDPACHAGMMDRDARNGVGRALHPRLALLVKDHARVPDLAAPLPVEGRLLRDDLDLSAFPGRRLARHPSVLLDENRRDPARRRE